jgi:hypothetical protein
MAKQFIKTNPASGGEAMAAFKNLLKTCGWTHQASSTGQGGTFTTTPGNANDLITSYYSNFYNNYTWWVGKHTDGRSILLMNGTSHAVWRIAYSFSAGFTGGTPSATVAPTATDNYDILGGSTSLYYNLFSGDGLQRFKAMAQDSAPYGWWLTAHFPANIGCNTGLFMDPLVAGSYPAEDTDPYVFGAFTVDYGNIAYTAGMFGREQAAPQFGCRGYLKKGLAGEGFVNIPGMYFRNYTRDVFPATLGSNPVNGKDDFLPIIYARPSALTAPVGYKGVSSLFKYLTVNRSTLSTLSKTTSRDKLVLGDVVVDWDGTTPEI